MKLDLTQFLNEVQDRIQQITGQDTRVDIQEVRKNNNVVLHGISIMRAGQNVSPTIYLEGFYDEYVRGMPMEKIVDKVLSLYLSGTPRKKLDMSFFTDFQQVKDRIVYRLINRSRNNELLERIPHIDFLDLAVCFYYAFQNKDLGNGMILIQNSHMEMWGTNHRELMRLAEENAPKLFPAELVSMEKMLEMIWDGDEMEKYRDAVNLYILTNDQRSQGAACVLYPGVLKRASKMLGGSFYVLPSSIHEVILLKDDGNQDKNYLHCMVRDINVSQVKTEECLSDYPYYYDAEIGRISQLFEL